MMHITATEAPFRGLHLFAIDDRNEAEAEAIAEQLKRDVDTRSQCPRQLYRAYSACAESEAWTE